MRPFLLAPLLAAAALLGSPRAADAGPPGPAAAPVALDIHFGVNVGVRYRYRMVRRCAPCLDGRVCCHWATVRVPYAAYYPYSSYRPPVYRYYSPRYVGPQYHTPRYVPPRYRYAPGPRGRWSPRPAAPHRVIGRRR